MWEDPIVAEVREIREKLAAKFGFNIQAIFADLRKRQGSASAKLIPQKNEPSRRLNPTETTILIYRKPRHLTRPLRLAIHFRRRHDTLMSTLRRRSA